MILFSALAAIALTSCRIDAGDNMGPRGPQGDPGISDVYVIQFEVQPNEWYGNMDGYKVVKYIDELTENVYQNGAVLLYRLNEGNGAKFANMLPYTYLFETTTEYMDFSAYVGHLDISMRWTDNGFNTTQAPGDVYIFKLVLIEGMNISTLKKNVNIASYDNVKKYFSIK